MKKTNETAQAGLEYLMTYGWALVLIVTVASVLFFVFSPSASTTTFSSSDPTKILLHAGNITVGATEIVLQNVTGGSIQLTEISKAGYSACIINDDLPEGTEFPISVPAGGQIVLECRPAENGTGTITLQYIDFSGLQRSVTINSTNTGANYGGLQLFEFNNNYTASQSGYSAFGGTIWSAQTFTPSAAHKITNAQLMLHKVVSPGTISVSIRATDGGGKPTGSDLCSGTTNGDTLPIVDENPEWLFNNAEWRDIGLGGGCSLSAGTRYAVVVRAPSGGVSNYAYWHNNGPNLYANGESFFSSNGGASWTSYGSYPDFLFEEWGTPA